MSDLLVSRTVPVALGPQSPENSIPVVLASSSGNAVLNVRQSQPETEVALSLLGIPRAETTLGVFSDITTYGIDTEIWAPFPEVWTIDNQGKGHGVRFLEYISCARIEAPPGKYAFLNTKRAFPYLPGRVSSSTFGLRSAFENRSLISSTEYDAISTRYDGMAIKPLRKWGQYSDKNGYYFEIRGLGENEDFKVVRRTNGIERPYIQDNYPVQSTILPENSYYSVGSTIKRAPSGIVADNLNYTHAVINDMSMEVSNTLANAVSVFDPIEGKIKCVAQENALVYEYRVPRSWFNSDQLNGKSNNPTYYSDVITINDVQYKPGELVAGSTDNSVRKIQFDKVTMYKSEYSWYGAIGCVFLTYVPVLESTARWVKTHYMRGSNQLSFPTLGNPYLPMRFYVQNSTNNAFSEGIEKYGASYYIDGADKGSVRVFSALNDSGPLVGTGEVNLPDILEWAIFSDFAYPYLKISPTAGNFTYLIDSYISGTISVIKNGVTYLRQITPGSIKINSVKKDQSGSVFLFLNKPIYDEIDSSNVSSIQPTPANLKAITPRGTTVMGMQMKKTIGPANVVSKSSVFPVRCNSSNIGSTPAIFRIMKNARRPIIVPIYGGNYAYAAVRNQVTINSEIREIPINLISLNNTDFVFKSNGECTVYIREIPGILKRVSRTTSGNLVFYSCTFTRYEPGDEIVLIPVPNSLAMGNLNVSPTNYGYDVALQEAGYRITSSGFIDADIGTDQNSFINSPDVFSAINYTVDDSVCCLVNTGQQLTTLMTSPNSTDDFDLTPYFGFNKEFLAGSGLSVNYRFDDTLLVVTSVLSDADLAATSEIAFNITWEEQ